MQLKFRIPDPTLEDLFWNSIFILDQWVLNVHFQSSGLNLEAICLLVIFGFILCVLFCGIRLVFIYFGMLTFGCNRFTFQGLNVWYTIATYWFEDSKLGWVKYFGSTPESHMTSVWIRIPHGVYFSKTVMAVPGGWSRVKWPEAERTNEGNRESW
jgi:hypothetical protein